MASIQATRLKRGMLIKVQNDLFRVLDLQHFTPGNKRGFVQAKMRNIRTGLQADNKFRAEEDVERAIVDERQMQYLYRDGDSFHFMDTENYDQLHIDAEVLGDNASYMVPESLILVEFYDEKPVGIELPVTVDLKVSTPCRASTARPRAPRSSRRRSRPGWWCRCRRLSASATRCGSAPKPASI